MKITWLGRICLRKPRYSGDLQGDFDLTVI